MNTVNKNISGTTTLFCAENPLIDMTFITTYTGMTDKWFYKLIGDGLFPKPIKLGRSSRWFKKRSGNLDAAAYCAVSSVTCPGVSYREVTDSPNRPESRRLAHPDSLPLSGRLSPARRPAVRSCILHAKSFIARASRGR